MSLIDKQFFKQTPLIFIANEVWYPQYVCFYLSTNINSMNFQVCLVVWFNGNVTATHEEVSGLIIGYIMGF